MNQIFCFKRYLWSLKRQWFENVVVYKFGAINMLLFIGFMFFAFSNLTSKPHLAQEPAFYVTSIINISIYGFAFFEFLNEKSKGMFYFSAPVSPLERLAVAFTYVMIIVPVLFLTVFFVFDALFVQIFNTVHDEATAQMIFKSGLR